ncbi:MAG: sulfur transferase domain-containing protein [Parvularcula sp.]|nr:sulfur transferase domain-containing protein [Parvularcula sp.]
MLYGPFQYDSKLSLGGALDADDIAALPSFGFDMLVNHRPDGESARQLSEAELEDRALAVGLSFVSLPFRGSKMTAADVDTFIDALRRGRKIMATCATGTRCAMIASAADIRRGMPLDMALQKAERAGFDLGPLAAVLAGFTLQMA